MNKCILLFNYYIFSSVHFRICTPTFSIIVFTQIKMLYLTLLIMQNIFVYNARLVKTCFIRLTPNKFRFRPPGCDSEPWTWPVVRRRQLLDDVVDFDQPLLVRGCRHGLLRAQRIKRCITAALVITRTHTVALNLLGIKAASVLGLLNLVFG